MFCIVRITEEEKGFFSKLKYLFNRRLPQLEKINIKAGAPFYYLEISKKQIGNNNEILSKILGRCSQYIIPCRDTVITDNSYIKKYIPTVFPSIMLINSAVNLLLNKSYDKSKYSIAITDKNAQFVKYIEEFINLASVITIYTDNGFSYNQLAEELYLKYGASLIIKSTESMDYNSDLTVSTGYDESIVERIDGKLIKLTGEYFELPAEYEKLRPAQIDKILFSSALFELCGVKSLESMKYNSFFKTELQ